MSEQKLIVQPPLFLDVLDRHGGFTAQTKGDNTLWRPGQVLKGKTTGQLQKYKTDSFYQLNNNVTQAWYKVPGYGYLVVCWFDNVTRERIA